MTAIKESNCKRINTRNLFEEFKVYEENLSMNSDDLRINRGYIYNQVIDVFEDITVTDMAIDKCGTLYLVDKAQIDNKQNQGQADNKQIDDKQVDNKQNKGKNLYRFHANEQVLEKIGNAERTFSLALKTISAIGVDNDTIYIADFVSSDPDDQTEKSSARLIALTKNDLQVRWTLSTGPDGRPLNKIHSIQCDNWGKIYVLEGSEKRIIYVNTGDVCYPAFRRLFDFSFKQEQGDFKCEDMQKALNDAIDFKLEQGDFKPQTLALGVDGTIYVLFVNEEGSEKRLLNINTGDVCYPAFRHLFDFSFKQEQGDFKCEDIQKALNDAVNFKLEQGDFKSQTLALGVDGTIYVLFVNDEVNKKTLSETEWYVLKPQTLTLGVDGTLYILFVNDEANKKTLSETKGYVLKILWTKKEKFIEIIEPKISIFSPSGIAVDIWNQIFIGETKTDIPLPIRKLLNDACEPWKSLTTYKLTDESSRIGASRKLISDPIGNFYVINDKDKLTLLDRKELNFQNKNGYFEGTYISKPIDSQISDTYWHRLLLEGEFEKGTQVDLHYFVSNNKDEGPQDPESNKWLNCISKGSAIQGSNKRDALFIDNIKGRYLWFKITLSGNENLSPAVKSVTIFFPRISYLDYLPGIYQESPVSKGLLERFLAIFESIFYEIDFTIDHISRYFDTCGAPPDFLSWLASWLDVSIDEDWPEDKKRLFIRNAISLYKKRGTRECLEESIELFTGKKPFVVERFHAFKGCTGSFSQPCNKEKKMSFPSQENIFFPPSDLKVKECPENKDNGDEVKEELLIDKLYGTERFSFCVLLKDTDLDATAQSRIMRIIDEQKPAHTSYELKILEPRFYLDMHTYLEINTVVTEPKFVIEETSIIGRDTVLHDEEKAGQIERHSRIGVDILLS